jgi:hypothetical protein
MPDFLSGSRPYTKDESLYIEPILAFRLWGVTNDGILIPAYARGQKLKSWNPERITPAECDTVTHSSKPPLGRCTCGFYGSRTLLSPVNTLMAECHIMRGPNGEIRVWAVGGVYMWGKMIEHDRGFRSEFAYPAWLYVGPMRPLKLGAMDYAQLALRWADFTSAVGVSLSDGADDDQPSAYAAAARQAMLTAPRVRDKYGVPTIHDESFFRGLLVGSLDDGKTPFKITADQIEERSCNG